MSRLTVHTETCPDPTGTMDFVYVSFEDGKNKNPIFSGLFNDPDTDRKVAEIITRYALNNIPVFFDRNCYNKWRSFAGNQAVLNEDFLVSTGHRFFRVVLVGLFGLFLTLVLLRLLKLL